MNSSERKDKLLKLIEESTKPIKGNELAEKLNVSRQIIVQDIALIRATGKDIIKKDYVATSYSPRRLPPKYHQR